MALYATSMPLPSDTFHDKLFACDQGDDADYDHDPRGGAVDLYATSMPLPSDTFHPNLWGPRWCVSNLGSSTVLLGLVTGIIIYYSLIAKFKRISQCHPRGVREPAGDGAGPGTDAVPDNCVEAVHNSRSTVPVERF